MAYQGASFFATDSNWEVQRTNHFELLIADFDQAGGNAGGKEGGNASDNGNKGANGAVNFANLRLAVEAVKMPSVQIATTDLRHGNEIVKVATNPQYDGGSITVKDAIGADIEMVLWAWYTRVLDVANDSIMGLVRNYKRDARLVQWSPDNSVSRTWRCTGVFPTSIQPGDFNYAQPEKKMITCNFSVDKAFPERSQEKTKT